MSTIVTRAGKGSALTHNEVDANFTNLNTDKVEKSGTDPVVISVDSSSDALRITQTGTGNCLVVEDSANPDSTPFVVNADGTVIVGSDTAQTLNNLTASIQVNGTGFNNSSISATRFNATAGSSPSFTFGRSRGATVGTNTTVVSGDTVGSFFFRAADGTSYVDTASITVAVDGTPGTNDMPGRLVFSTTADGASTPTERMRLDSAGNLGLGVTPSAWSSSYRAEDIGTGGAIAYSSSGTDVWNNAFVSSTQNTYKTTSFATVYRQSATGQHQWFTAPSGTAGNAITFTQAMTLDASGNLGVGTTSPNSFSGTVKLVVGSAATTTTPGAVTVYSGNATYGGLYFADGTVGDQLYRGAVEYNHSTDTLLMYSAGSARMRIDSSGNVGIGTSSPGEKLDVVGNAKISGDLQFNSGYGSVATAFGCRAWVNFNGTGTVAIRASGNVSSITDNGTGDYTVNFTTAMPDANYAVVGSGATNTTANARSVMPFEYSTTSVRIRTRSGSDGLADLLFANVAIFR